MRTEAHMDEFDFESYDDVINLALAQLDSILEGYGDNLPAIEESIDEMLSAQDDP